MKKNQTAQISAGQMKELTAAVIEGLPVNIDAGIAQYWIGNKKKLSAEMEKIFKIFNPYEFVIAEWQTFYRDVFGVGYDFPNLVIPPKQAGLDRLLVMTDDSLEQLYAKCNELFPCGRWTNDNLDKIVIYNERTTKNGPYAIRVRGRVEADEELKNLSANQMRQQNIATETLAERLIHELKFFKETGQHLDTNNVTLCAGSRYSDGGVPHVRWYHGEMGVSWCGPGRADDGLRSRLVVS